MTPKPSPMNCAKPFCWSLSCFLLIVLSALDLRAVEPAIAAGHRFSLFLKSDGTAWGTGYNVHGQLGVGDSVPTKTSTPNFIMGGVKAIAAGNEHSLFLMDGGIVLACGNNVNGEIGDGSMMNRRSPVPVSIDNVKSISAGHRYSLFLKNDGTVWACGNNSGKLGDGTGMNRTTPVQVQISDVVSISAGYSHSLFLKADGTVWACGENYYFQFGNGTDVPQFSPIQVMTGAKAISASAGAGNGAAISLVVKTDGTVWAAGSNGMGQLGDGTTQSAVAGSTFVQSLISGVDKITSTMLQSRFLKSDGTAWASGTFGAERIGTDHVGSSFSPILAHSEILEISAYSHCLYLRKDGTVIAAGANEDGELGDGTNSPRAVAVPIMSLGRMLNVTVTAGGTVTGAGAYVPDETATLTASPALGYLFAGWEGDVTGAETEVSVQMDASKNVTAKFVRNMTDADGDGLTFFEEVVIHGTDPDLADTDGDGFNDGFEVLTGFEPTSATSTPDALSSIRTAVEFRFNAADGVSYRIESSPDLESWETVESPIVGEGGTVTRFYSIENQPKRYFRARRN